MKIKYNAPVTLSFALLCTAIVAADQTMQPGLVQQLFTVQGRELFDWNYFPGYVKLLTHVLGHLDWQHLMQNMTFILLLGPILEEKYGGINVAFMIFLTALITGIVNAFFFVTALTGASGIVFMMILLASFSNIKQGEIPLTFFLIVALYLGKEVKEAFQADGISQVAHIVGGICGSLFGFIKNNFSGKSQPGSSGPPPSGVTMAG